MDAQAENESLGSMAAFDAHRVVDQLLRAADFLAVAEELMEAAKMDGSSGVPSAFAQYAGMVLEQAGARRLLESPRRRALKLLAPEDGTLARLACADTVPEDEAATVASVENAINRLVCITDSLFDGFYEGDTPSGSQVGYSFMGSGYIPIRASFRSAQVLLPRVGAYGGTTTGFFNEVDWRVMDAIAGNGRAVFQRSVLINPGRSVWGVQAPDKSDWDMRTRLARILDCLELPLRCSLQFDCDAQRNAISVRLTCPDAAELPLVLRRDEQGHACFVSCSPNVYRVFLLRLACLLGAACFGSGRTVETAYVSAVDGAGKAVLACEFERTEFVRNVIAAIDDGRLSSPAMRGNVYGIARMINARRLEWADVEGHVAGDGGHVMETQRPDPRADERELPADVRELFHARRVCDLVFDDDDAGIPDAVADALQGGHEHPLVAIAQLESTVALIEEKFQPPAGCPDAHPLYAPSPLLRLAVHLAGDQLDVAQQAEALLREAAGGEAVDTVPVCFPITGEEFWPFYALGSAYFVVGNLEGTSAMGDRCIQLAPTLAHGYELKAKALSAQGQAERAANVLVQGLRYAATAEVASELYYCLGSVLMYQGVKDVAAAVFVYNAALGGPYAERSARVVEQLQKMGNLPREYASRADAARYMGNAGIPEAPVDMRRLVAQAALGLSCAGVPRVAAIYAGMLVAWNPGNDLLVDVWHSLAGE